MCYTWLMSDRQFVDVKRVQLKNYLNEPLSEKDRQVLLAALESGDEACIVPALLGFMEADRRSVLFFVDQYDRLDASIKKLALTMSRNNPINI